MIRLLFLLPLLCLLAAPTFAQGSTSLRLVVLDAGGAPVAGLRLTLLFAGDEVRQVETDERGMAFARQLVGELFFVQAARKGNTAMQIDGTMADGSLRLGLVPGQERTVLLRLDENILTVDGETLFAGVGVPPSVATLDAQAPAPPPPSATVPATETPTPSATVTPTVPTAGATAAPSATTDAATRTTTAPAPTSAPLPTATPAAEIAAPAAPWAGWPLALVVLIALPLATVGVGALVRGRQRGGRP